MNAKLSSKVKELEAKARHSVSFAKEAASKSKQAVRSGPPPPKKHKSQPVEDDYDSSDDSDYVGDDESSDSGSSGSESGSSGSDVTPKHKSKGKSKREPESDESSEYESSSDGSDEPDDEDSVDGEQYLDELHADVAYDKEILDDFDAHDLHAREQYKDQYDEAVSGTTFTMRFVFMYYYGYYLWNSFDALLEEDKKSKEERKKDKKDGKKKASVIPKETRNELHEAKNISAAFMKRHQKLRESLYNILKDKTKFPAAFAVLTRRLLKCTNTVFVPLHEVITRIPEMQERIEEPVCLISKKKLSTQKGIADNAGVLMQIITEENGVVSKVNVIVSKQICSILAAIYFIVHFQTILTMEICTCIKAEIDAQPAVMPLSILEKKTEIDSKKTIVAFAKCYMRQIKRLKMVMPALDCKEIYEADKQPEGEEEIREVKEDLKYMDGVKVEPSKKSSKK